MRVRSRITFIVVGFILLLCACEKQNKSSHNHLHLNLTSDPSSLDPRVARSISDLTLTKQLFEGLYRIDEKGAPVLALAQHCELSNDGKEYLFTLREAFWSDGKRVTAYDFEYAWKKVLDPNFATDYAHMLFMLKNARDAKLKRASIDSVGVKAIDETHLSVTLEKPTAYFLELLAFPTFFPVPRNIDESHPSWSSRGDSHFISNGPYRLKTWHITSLLEFEKNPLYWDSSHVSLDGLSFSILADQMTESYLFDKAELDWLGQPLSQNISPEATLHYKNKGKLLSYPVAGTMWVQCNTEKFPFNNAKMRKAFAMAFSREELITHILQGNQRPAYTLLPPTLPVSTPSFTDNDPIKAKALFEEALIELRTTREKLAPLALTFPSGERDVKIAEYLQESWQKCFDLSIDLDISEKQCFKSKIKTSDFQIAYGGWIADFNDPATFLEIFKYKGGMNNTAWEDPAFAALLDRAAIELDQEKRLALMKQAESLLMDQMVVMPIYFYAFDYVKQNNVTDVTLSPLGGADFKCAKIKR